ARTGARRSGDRAQLGKGAQAPGEYRRRLSPRSELARGNRSPLHERVPGLDARPPPRSLCPLGGSGDRIPERGMVGKPDLAAPAGRRGTPGRSLSLDEFEKREIRLKIAHEF